MLYIAISDAQRKGKFNRDRLIPSSCKAVLVMLDKRIPKNWTTACEDTDQNYLVITATNEVKAPDEKSLLKALYRELANELTFVAQNSPEENLQRVLIVRMELHHPKKIITAYAHGKDVARLATLKDEALILEHLKSKFQVREKIPK